VLSQLEDRREDVLEPPASVAAVRAQIESGALRGAALRDRLLAVPFLERDAWIDAVLGIAQPPPDHDLPRGAVPYLPCGIAEILTMLADVPVRPDDEVVDLGSGLGRVVILAHLLTGAPAWGVEIQDHLVRGARARTAALALPVERVAFVHANAADIELDGSVFFLYAPFNGDLLTRVLCRLEAVARRRAIVVCTVGLALDGIAWLSSRPSSTVAFDIYDSVPSGLRD
jgi:SAM-dependent methyltransferase